jgi:RND family efflux transporter MFP subunit
MTQLASLKKAPAETVTREQALRVATLTVQPVDIPVFITGYGEVRTLNAVTISPEISGTIVKIHPRLETGETITEGELLFQIDPANYTAAEKEARANVAQWESAIARLEKQFIIDTGRLKTLRRNEQLAQKEFSRIQTLFKSDNVGTRSGMDRAEQAYNGVRDLADQMAQAVTLYPIRIKEAQSTLNGARARLTLATTNLKRCTIISPFTARIKSVTLEKGQYVSPGQGVVTLADDSILEIHVPTDSRDARQWLLFNRKPAASKTAWFAGLEPAVCKIHWTEDTTGHVWQGRLNRIVQFHRETRTLTLAVRIDAAAATAGNPGQLPLVEGMFCTVEIPGKTLKQVFKLPSQAVSFSNTVYTADSRNRLKTVTVDVSRAQGETIFVSGGLNPGDRVIVTRLIDPLEGSLLEINTPPVTGEKNS